VDPGTFFAEHGIRVHRVMTDRSRSYTMSQAFQDALQTLRIRHKITRPYRPQTNGKAERFIQTLLGEWAYTRLYRSNEERRRAFPKWLSQYNHHRPHTALGGQPPIAAVVNNLERVLRCSQPIGGLFVVSHPADVPDEQKSCVFLGAPVGILLDPV
jgi:hypothetical protein